jgi:hypothetical protein
MYVVTVIICHVNNVYKNTSINKYQIIKYIYVLINVKYNNLINVINVLIIKYKLKNLKKKLII